MKAINRTNAATVFREGVTLTDAFADRETLQKEREILAGLIQAATEQRFMYSRTEIRHVVTINIGEIQNRIDRLSKQLRELDTAVQQLNWQVDLIE